MAYVLFLRSPLCKIGRVIVTSLTKSNGNYCAQGLQCSVMKGTNSIFSLSLSPSPFTWVPNFVCLLLHSAIYGMLCYVPTIMLSKCWGQDQVKQSLCPKGAHRYEKEEGWLACASTVMAFRKGPGLHYLGSMPEIGKIQRRDEPWT
jgi:hypothetical protein